MSQTTYTPLNSNEQLMFGFWLVFIVPFAFTGVGFITLALTIYGLYFMRKNQDISYIETAYKVLKVITYLWLVGCLIFTAVGLFDYVGSVIEYNSCIKIDERYCYDPRVRAELVAPIVFSFFGILYFLLLKFFFYNPLVNHEEWVIKNGIFSTKEKALVVTENSPNIFNNEGIKQYSVADELLKWAKLKEDGLISDKEFEQAKAKILGK
jgi:hypothetical protein